MAERKQVASRWWTRDDRAHRATVGFDVPPDGVPPDAAPVTYQSHEASVSMGAATDHRTVRLAVSINVKSGQAGCPSCGRGMPMEVKPADPLIKNALSYVGSIELREADLLAALDELRKGTA